MKKEFQDFKKNKPTNDLSVKQIITKYNDMRSRNCKMKWKIRRKKQLIGFTSGCITNIIIPIKQSV